jgi:hypothetical protein
MESNNILRAVRMPTEDIAFAFAWRASAAVASEERTGSLAVAYRELSVTRLPFSEGREHADAERQ